MIYFHNDVTFIILIKTKAINSREKAEVAPANVVVRFSEAVDYLLLPKCNSRNPDLQVEQTLNSEVFIKDRK